MRYKVLVSIRATRTTPIGPIYDPQIMSTEAISVFHRDWDRKILWLRILALVSGKILCLQNFNVILLNMCSQTFQFYEMLTVLGTSCKSKTTRASMCQYSARCTPLCSNHILPGCGQGILPLTRMITKLSIEKQSAGPYSKPLAQVINHYYRSKVDNQIQNHNQVLLPNGITQDYNSSTINFFILSILLHFMLESDKK